MALNVKTLATRALTALFFVIVLMYSIRTNYYSFLAFFFIVSIIGLKEFYALSEKLNAKPYKAIGYIGAFILLLGSVNTEFLFGFKNHLIYFSVLIPSAILATSVFSIRPNPMHNSLYTVFGLVYAVFPFTLLNEVVLAYNEANGLYNFEPGILVGVILLIWCNDTFAYLGGSVFGRRKLIERISPAKTWEGTLIGIFSTFLGSFYVASFFETDQGLYWMSLGILVPLMATIGDLVESMMKRQANIKDTGSIMPGHGGILDRFDSMIFVAPMVYLILKVL